MPSRLGITTLLFTSLLLTPAAAHAAPATAADGLSIEATNVIAAIGTAGSITSVALTNSGDEPIELPEVRLTADAGDLRGRAVVDGGSDCTGDGSTLVCTYPQTTVDAHSYVFLPNLTVRATSGARAGDRGTVKIAVGEATATVKVTLADPVNLVAGPELTVAGEPGSTVTFAPGVINAGDRPINGTVLTAGTGSVNVLYDRTFSNCQYTDHEFFCFFDEVLTPGKQYVPAVGVPLTIRADAPAPMRFRSAAQWLTPTDAERFVDDFKARHSVITAGTGGPLRLVEKTAVAKAGTAARAAADGAQTDTNDLDNSTDIYVDITGENPPDEAAIGASASGAAGTVVEVNVGLRNLGPARLDPVINNPTIDVVIPSGVTVTAYDDRWCSLIVAPRTYRCAFDEIEVGQSVTVAFSLRVRSTGDSTGSVTIATAEYDGTPGPDADRSNNTAPLVVTRTA